MHTRALFLTSAILLVFAFLPTLFAATGGRAPATLAPATGPAPALPSISLTVKDVTLPQVVNALNSNLKVSTFEASEDPGPFTLDLREKPLWEIFSALHQQQPLLLAFTSTGISLSQVAKGVPIAFDGPVLFCAGNVSEDWRQTPPLTKIEVKFAVDPRFHVMITRGFKVLSATDDTGADIARPQDPSFGGVLGNFGTQALTLAPRSKDAKTFSVKLQTSVLVGLSDVTVTLEDVANHLNQAVTAGGRTYRVTKFAIEGDTISLAVEAGLMGASANRELRTTLVLLDAASKIVWSSERQTSATILAGNSKGPYKLEFRTPDKTAEFSASAELKNVPWR